MDTFSQADLGGSSKENKEKWAAYAAVDPQQVSYVPPAMSLANDPIVPVGSECSLYLPDGQSCNKKYAGKNCRKYFFKGEDGEFYRCRFHKGDDADGQCGEIGKGGWFSKKKKCHEDEKDKSLQAEKRKKMPTIMEREKNKQAAEEKERKRKADESKVLSDKCDFFGRFSKRNIFSEGIPYMESAEAYRQCLKEKKFDKYSYNQPSMGGRDEIITDNRREGGMVNSGGLPLNFNKFKEYFEKNGAQISDEKWNAFKIKAEKHIAEENKKEDAAAAAAAAAASEAWKKIQAKKAKSAARLRTEDGMRAEVRHMSGFRGGGARKKIQKKTKKKKYKSKTNKKKLRKSGRKSVRKGGRKRVRKGGRKSVRKGVRVAGRKKSKRRRRN
jgi:hypothetical protein